MKLSNLGALGALVTTCVLGLGCAAPTEGDEGEPVDPSIVIDDGSGDVDPATFRGTAYTSSAPTQVRSAPYLGDNGFAGGGSASRTFGSLSVHGEQAIAGGERHTAIIKDQFFAPPAESLITVGTTVSVERAYVKVVGTGFPFPGHAKGDVTLHLRVISPSGLNVCSQDLLLAQTEGVLGEHRNDFVPRTVTLSCPPFPKDASTGQNYRTEVSISTFRESWGPAWVESSASARVASITWSRRVEPGMIVGHQGLCLEPAGAAVSGVSTRLGECEGRADQRWIRHAAGAILHRASGLCLNVSESAPTDGVRPRLATCVWKTPPVSARFTVDSFGVVTHSSGKCLHAAWPEGGLTGDFHNTPVQLSGCSPHRPGYQVWAIQ